MFEPLAPASHPGKLFYSSVLLLIAESTMFNLDGLGRRFAYFAVFRVGVGFYTFFILLFPKLRVFTSELSPDVAARIYFS